LRAVVYDGPGKLDVREVSKPRVGPLNLLIRVRAAGICGSDLELVRGLRPDVKPPRIPGHEISGEIVELGMQATRAEVGDRVVVEPIVSCGRCRNCAIGRYNICQDLKFMGVHIDGAFAEYLAVPEQRVYKIPDNLPYDQAAVLEPTAVGVHIVSRANISIGDTVVILGAGPIALQIAQVARKRGAGYIIMTDILDYRLELAEKLAADRVVNVDEEDPLQVVKEETDCEGADVVIEAVGRSDTIAQAMDLVRRGGTILVGGLNVERFVSEPPTFWMNLLYKEVTVQSSRSYAVGNWSAAIRLASKGEINLKALVTHRFPLEEASRAFEVADRKLENAVKVLLIP